MESRDGDVSWRASKISSKLFHGKIDSHMQPAAEISRLLAPSSTFLVSFDVSC